MKQSSRSSVSRETAVSPNALARSAACGVGMALASLMTLGATLGAPLGAPSNMRNQQGEGRWCHAIDPAGLANGLRPDGGKLLPGLVRKPLDPCIVQLLRKSQTLVPPEGRNIGGLAAQVDVVLGVDLELLEDPGREVAKARPDPPNRIDPDRRERQELEGAATLTIPVEGEATSLGLVRGQRHRSGKFRGGHERTHLLRMAALPLGPHAAESNALLGQPL